MNTKIITQKDLEKATQYTRGGDIARLLTKCGIRFFNGRNGQIWTTIDLINAAGGLNSQIEFMDKDDII